MANRIVATLGLLFVLLLLLLPPLEGLLPAHTGTDCRPWFPCLYPRTAEYSIKKLMELSSQAGARQRGVTDHDDASVTTRGIKVIAGVNQLMRKVPSGPDPMHHNGGSPRKPRIIP